MKKIETVLIIGVGLIGGSLGKAIKKKKLAREVLGFSRKQSTLLQAKRAKAIDRGSTQLEKVVPQADLIVLATPVNKIITLSKKIAALKKPDCVVTDVGSVKGSIVSVCDPLFKGMFLGGHPMAGSEKSGVVFADEKIFQKSICILTPTKKTRPKTKQLVSDLWRAVGAKLHQLTPKEHDNITAFISHFPHLLSVALVQSIETDQNKYLKFAGTGFKDMTRLAGGDPQLWVEILLSNKTELKKTLNKSISLLNHWKKNLETEKTQVLLADLKKANRVRKKLA